MKGKRKHNQGGLMEVAWHRVVLDEAHTIRNRTTKLFKAATALQATHRWAVTGAVTLTLTLALALTVTGAAHGWWSSEAACPLEEVPCAGIRLSPVLSTHG